MQQAVLFKALPPLQLARRLDFVRKAETLLQLVLRPGIVLKGLLLLLLVMVQVNIPKAQTPLPLDQMLQTEHKELELFRLVLTQD
jgi:hypothetical protein